MQRGKRRHEPKIPKLMGEPSPSLAKIRTMDSAALTARIDTLTIEADRLKDRIRRLTVLDPRPDDKIRQLTDLFNRLQALEKAARDRLNAMRSPSSGYRSGGSTQD